MKITHLLILPLYALCFTVLANQQTAIITIDDVEHKIDINNNHKITIGHKEHIINVRLDKHQLFKIDGVSFSYNSNMTYSVATSSDTAFPMWSLEGDSNSITVMMIQTATAFKDIEELMEVPFKKMKATVESKKESSLEYQDSKLQGVKFHIKTKNNHQSFELYSKIIDGKTIVFMIDDILNEDLSNTQEYQSTLKLLKETLRIR